MKRLWAILGALAVVVASAACGNGGDATENTAAQRFVALHDSLCRSVQQARSGDLVAARKTFLDNAHEGLHELATVGSDRALVARMLEAKQLVEADVADASAPDGDLASHLEALSLRTEAVLDSQDIAIPERCTS
jgi:hypothetical protein